MLDLPGRSGKGLWCPEEDYYVHLIAGRPVSVEAHINCSIETPISQSDTWNKIESGRADTIDRSDRAILYALVRHLEVRTPHFSNLGRELAEMAADPNHPMPFTDEEREMYAAFRADPNLEKLMANTMALKRFDERAYDSAMMTVTRSAVPFRTATTPILLTKVPEHPSIYRPFPGFVPFQRSLVLNRRTMVTVIDGDFDGHFSNIAADDEWTHGVNRTFAGQFAHFPNIRHLLTSRHRLIDDMQWAPYDIVSDTPKKIVFRRKTDQASST